MGIAQVLRSLPKVTDPNLLVGTDTHDDAGVYKLTDDIALVQTIDFFPPVVNDPYIYGQIAAANALSDVYAMGGTPKTALNLVGYPDDKDPELTWLGKILEGGAERCTKAGTVIIGGHTVRDSEIKFGMAVTGLIHPQKIMTNASALVLPWVIASSSGISANQKRPSRASLPSNLMIAPCRLVSELPDASHAPVYPNPCTEPAAGSRSWVCGSNARQNDVVTPMRTARFSTGWKCTSSIPAAGSPRKRDA